jgi:hypothetical protein
MQPRINYPFPNAKDVYLGVAALPWVHSQVADSGILTRYGGYQENKISGTDLCSIYCLAGRH